MTEGDQKIENFLYDISYFSFVRIDPSLPSFTFDGVVEGDQKIEDFLYDIPYFSFTSIGSFSPSPTFDSIVYASPQLNIDLNGFSELNLHLPNTRKAVYQKFNLTSTQLAIFNELDNLRIQEKEEEEEEEESLEEKAADLARDAISFLPGWIQEDLEEGASKFMDFMNDMEDYIGSNNAVSALWDLTKNSIKEGKKISQGIESIKSVENYSDAKSLLNSYSFGGGKFLDNPTRDKDTGLIDFIDASMTKEYWVGNHYAMIQAEKKFLQDFFTKSSSKRENVIGKGHDVPYENGSTLSCVSTYTFYVASKTLNSWAFNFSATANAVKYKKTVNVNLDLGGFKERDVTEERKKNIFLEHAKIESKNFKKEKRGISDIVKTLDAHLYYYIAYFTDSKGEYVKNAMGGSEENPYYYYFFLDKFQASPVKKKEGTLKYGAFSTKVALNAPDGKNEISFTLKVTDLQLTLLRKIYNEMGYSYGSNVFAHSKNSSGLTLNIVLLKGTEPPMSRTSGTKDLDSRSFAEDPYLYVNVFRFLDIKFSSIGKIEMAHDKTDIVPLEVKGTYKRLLWDRHKKLTEL